MLLPLLFNIYKADISVPEERKNAILALFEDDTTVASSPSPIDDKQKGDKVLIKKIDHRIR